MSPQTAVYTIVLALGALFIQQASPAQSSPPGLINYQGVLRDNLGKPLTLQERIKAQEAIERINYSHRIWPRDNPGPKPPFEQMVPRAQIEAKAKDYLKKSSALEKYWQKPITGEQLQAEMDRMASSTNQPGVLLEIFNALNNDPVLIAECLARPALVDISIRSAYAFDEHFHGESKRKAHDDLLRFPEAAQMDLMSGNYSEIEWVKSDGKEADYIEHGTRDQILLSEEQWVQFRNRLLDTLGTKGDTIPIGMISRLQEDQNRFYVLAVLDEQSDRVKVAAVE